MAIEDVLCSPLGICAVIGVLFAIIMLMSYLRAKREAEAAAQRGPPGSQPRMAEPVPRGYEQAPSYGTTPYPQPPPSYSYTPQPQGAPSYPTAPSTPGAPAEYTPVLLVQGPSERRRTKTPGACPRCGSTNIQNFGTGEHKCLDCKKIYMD